MRVRVCVLLRARVYVLRAVEGVHVRVAVLRFVAMRVGAWSNPWVCLLGDVCL